MVLEAKLTTSVGIKRLGLMVRGARYNDQMDGVGGGGGVQVTANDNRPTVMSASVSGSCLAYVLRSKQSRPICNR